MYCSACWKPSHPTLPVHIFWSARLLSLLSIQYNLSVYKRTEMFCFVRFLLPFVAIVVTTTTNNKTTYPLLAHFSIAYLCCRCYSIETVQIVHELDRSIGTTSQKAAADQPPNRGWQNYSLLYQLYFSCVLLLKHISQLVCSLWTVCLIFLFQ